MVSSRDRHEQVQPIVPDADYRGVVPVPRPLAARRQALGEFTRFVVVGTLSLVVDLVVFNAALLVLPHKPLTAKVVSTVVSATNAYLLNRHWSFRGRERDPVAREMPLFMALNGIGMLIALGCLALSHYGLGLTSRLADNVAANGVGLVLGTAFRFWSYRRFVWKDVEEPAAERAAGELPQPVLDPA